MTSKKTMKVQCKLCMKVLLRKNYQRHLKKIHPLATPNYVQYFSEGLDGICQKKIIDRPINRLISLKLKKNKALVKF